MYSQFMMYGQKNIKLPNLLCVKFQNIEDLIYTAAGAWNSLKIIWKREQPNVTFSLQPHLLTLLCTLHLLVMRQIRFSHPCNLSLYLLLQKCWFVCCNTVLKPLCLFSLL